MERKSPQQKSPHSSKEETIQSIAVHQRLWAFCLYIFHAISQQQYSLSDGQASTLVPVLQQPQNVPWAWKYQLTFRIILFSIIKCSFRIILYFIPSRPTCKLTFVSAGEFQKAPARTFPWKTATLKYVPPALLGYLRTQYGLCEYANRRYLFYGNGSPFWPLFP